MGISVRIYILSNKGEELDFYGVAEDDLKQFEVYFPNKMMDIVDERIDYLKTLKLLGKIRENFVFHMHDSKHGICYREKDYNMTSLKEALKDKENFIVYNGRTINKQIHSKGVIAKLLYDLDKPINMEYAIKLENEGEYRRTLICTKDDLEKLHKIIDKDNKLEFEEHIMKRFREGIVFVFLN